MRFLSVNCPLSVRELRPKGAEHEQRDYAKSLINNGWLWACLYLYEHEFPLITQRSQVQILPPQPFRGRPTHFPTHQDRAREAPDFVF